MIKEYYLRLKRVFSLRFLGFLLFSQLFVKGTVVLIASSLLMPIFKKMNMDAIHVQLYITLSMSPWSIKPVIGVISDVVAIGGYHKKYYILQSIVVGVGVSIGLIFIPHSSTYSLLIVLCFFGLHYESSIVDLLSEGTYARLMRENPESGTDIVTLVNAFQTVGELLGLAFVGPLTDIDLFFPMFIIAAVFCFTPFIPTCLNWLPEPAAVFIPAATSTPAPKGREWRWKRE
jgi:BT1 family